MAWYLSRAASAAASCARTVPSSASSASSSEVFTHCASAATKYWPSARCALSACSRATWARRLSRLASLMRRELSVRRAPSCLILAAWEKRGEGQGGAGGHGK